MARRATYAASGVDYNKIDPLKVAAQRAARATSVSLRGVGAREVSATRGESAYVVRVGELFVATTLECLGTKALVADAVRPLTKRSYYDALAQDTIAMAVNDLVTVGALPLIVNAYWGAGGSSWFDDAERARDLINGWRRACEVCEVSWGGGETPALDGVVNNGRVDLAASAVGLIRNERELIVGKRLAAGDAIILVESSGIHANGVSLARTTAERLVEGYATRMHDGRTFGAALLEPTHLYAPLMRRLLAEKLVPHYCVNITGHGWRKLMRHTKSLGYHIDRLPPVPLVLDFLVETLGIGAYEAYSALNMGAGFAIFVKPRVASRVISCAAECGLMAWDCGRVTKGPKQIHIEPLGLAFKAKDLKVRT